MIEYIFTGPFGIFPMVFKYLISMLTPLVTLFTFFQILLTESGILSHMGKTLSKPLSCIGLSRDCLLPLLLGFGCTTVALSSLSNISSSRERYIASFLLSVAIPCSAQIAIIFAISFILPAWLFTFYLVSVLVVFSLSGIILNRLLPKDSLICIPYNSTFKFHFPSLTRTFRISIMRGFNFLKENIITFSIGSALLSFLSYYGLIENLCNIFSPLTQNFLHLPKESAAMFVMSIIKRDFGAAGLLSAAEYEVFTSRQLAVSILVLTLFVPCFASMLILIKQEKLPKAISIWLGSLIISLVIGKVASILLL